jgi:hypothetical protein
MSALPLLEQLRHAGLTVSRCGDRIIVTPKARLTDELRNAIREAKPKLLSILPVSRPDIDDRIREMAARWHYSVAELAEALAGAQSDPQGWLAWTEQDERDFGNCVTPEDFAQAYRRTRGLE